MKLTSLSIVRLTLAAVWLAPAVGTAAPGDTAAPPKPAATKSTTAKPAAKPSTKTTAKPAAKPAASAAKAESTATTGVAQTTAPAAKATPVVKQSGEGEMDVNIKGTDRQKLVVGKFDPPAAFNLEDIQNFPEDRLQPLLNSPVTFNEGRDFSRMMDFKDDQPVHPWLPDIARAPFLQMQTPPQEKAARDWTFAIIDQGGTTVSKQDGKGAPPAQLVWDGEDTKRGRVAVETVYIPQLSTVDKEGYHHTYMGQPIQFASIAYKESGKTTIELSTKRLFAERKADFSKEGPLMLDKICDVIREGSHLPFAIQPYDDNDALARSRQEALVKYFTSKLFIPENQIVSSAPMESSKRGDAIAIISNAVPGGSGQ